MAEHEGVAKSSEAAGQPPGATAPVFISYASQDAAVANAIVENLEHHGIKCWIAPRDVTPGSQYADEIVAAINEAKVVVLVLSENAVASPHVGRETERAASKRRRIIVLRTDTAPLTRSFEYFLSESQWIDVTALGVPAALTKLTQAVRQRLAPSSWVSPGLGTDVRNPADQKRKPSYQTIKRLIAAAVFLVFTAAVAGVVVRYWPSMQQSRAPVAAAISDKSIAVLPFVDMSEKKDQEYFADGMTEEIIDLLVKIPGLKVTGRTSSFQFKGHNEDLRDIGKRLGVSYLLEGSVRKSGDQLRVTAQLIDSRNGTHLLSQTYDRELSDVLKIQDEIAATLVRTLQIQMVAAVAARGAINNTEAYTLSLQGWHAFERYDPAGFEEGTQDFQRALDLDPSFAVAASGLASTYLLAGEFGFMPPAVAFERSRQAAELFVKLDPTSGGAHGVLSSIHAIYDWDWAAADRETHLALDLAPYDTFNLQVAAQVALAEGKWDDALKHLNASQALDPLDPTCYLLLTWVQLRRGHQAEAERAARRLLEISPTFTYAHFILGEVLLAGHSVQDALVEMLKETDDAARLGGSAMAYFALARNAESDAALAQMQKDYGGYPYTIAAVHGFRGETGEALEWLERAYAQKDANLYRIKSEPSFSALAGDPRYKAFLKKMNFPE
jgi:TolB-like protein